MNIIERYGDHNKVLYKGRKIKYIVIHYNAGVTSKKGAAQNVANWYGNSACPNSSDFIVDDVEVVQYNGDIENTYTWHCGGEKYSNKGGKLYGVATNTNSIGIEICSTNSSGQMTFPNDSRYSFTSAAIVNTVELVRYLMEKYNIPPENVIRHYDTTGKICPGVIGWNDESGNTSAWENFKERIGAEAPKSNNNDYVYVVQRVQCALFKDEDKAKEYAKRTGAEVIRVKCSE